MAMNRVGMQPQSSFTLPPRTQKPQQQGQAQQKPSFQKLAAYEIGDKLLRFNPAGEQIDVSKGDDSGYWQALGYNA